MRKRPFALLRTLRLHHRMDARITKGCAPRCSSHRNMSHGGFRTSARSGMRAPSHCAHIRNCP